jgi:hypothetical protein
MWIVALIGFGLVTLAHTAPASFILDKMAGERAVWHMPRGLPATVYLTFDDGPNPATTPLRLSPGCLPKGTRSDCIRPAGATCC